MARNNRHHVTFADGATGADNLRPRSLTKQQFGKQLYNLMLDSNLNQNQLAQKAKLSRNQISTYVRGISFPNEQSLKKLARVLEVDVDLLLPNHVHAAIDDDLPLFSMQISPTAPDMAWLRINQLVMVDTAVAVQRLVREDKAAEEVEKRRAARKT